MIMPVDAAITRARELKQQGRKIVTTNGCFDILHIGHVRYLAEAKNLGDVLFVGVNGDASPYFKTKPGRPIIAEQERAEMLDALKPVDYVFVFNDETPDIWIRAMKPDIHVKASDIAYGIEQCIERSSVEAGGGRVVLIPKTEGKSTTNIVTQITRIYQEG